MLSKVLVRCPYEDCDGEETIELDADLSDDSGHGEAYFICPKCNREGFLEFSVEITLDDVYEVEDE